MQGETDVSYSLSALVSEVEGVALATAQSQEVSDNELSEVLSFLAKVSHVVEQAFRGVLLILIEIKFLRPNDLQPDRMQRLRHKTELVLARSHFRGAEGICSRLRTLTETYQTDLAIHVGPLADAYRWEGLFGLIQHREGRIIVLIEEVMSSIKDRLRSVNEANLSALTDYADRQAQVLKVELGTLSGFTNLILRPERQARYAGTAAGPRRSSDGRTRNVGSRESRTDRYAEDLWWRPRRAVGGERDRAGYWSASGMACADQRPFG